VADEARILVSDFTTARDRHRAREAAAATTHAAADAAALSGEL